MPDRTYRLGEHPTFKDRVFAHPFEIGLSLVLLLVGTRLFFDTTALPRSIDALPRILGFLFCAISIAGGGSVLVSLIWSKARQYGLEQAGLLLSASAWMTYAIGLIDQATTARSTLLLAAMLALSAAHVIRALALRRIAIARLDALRSRGQDG